MSISITVLVDIGFNHARYLFLSENADAETKNLSSLSTCHTNEEGGVLDSVVPPIHIDKGRGLIMLIQIHEKI